MMVTHGDLHERSEDSAVAQFENFMLGRSLSGPFGAKTQSFFFFLCVLASLRFFAN